MSCEEVQRYLLDFLDKSLDNERARVIEDHLAACSGCSEEMASLAECQRLVSGLPIVEPPLGFTSQVMARVREGGHSTSLWQRLFLPLRIKIPLQATAVVLIGVLAAYIYQKEPLQRESLVALQPQSSYRDPHEADRFAPSVVQAPTAHSKAKEVAEETKPRIQEFKDSALKGPQSTAKLDEQDKGVAGVQPDAPETARPQDQVRSPATLSPTPLQGKSSAASEAVSRRREESSSSGELQAKGALAPVPLAEKENISKDAAAAGTSLFSPEARQRSAAPSLDTLRSGGTVVGVAVPSDHELAIRLKEPVRDDKSGGLQAERRSFMSAEESKILDQALQRAVQTGQPQSVVVTTPRSRYDLFKKELGNVGYIEAENPSRDSTDNISKASDRLRIKLTILPPLSPVNPSQPASR